MARWMIELGRFELGGESARALMTTPYELGNGESTDYGLGLFIDQWRGLVRWQHGGGDAGQIRGLEGGVLNVFSEPSV